MEKKHSKAAVEGHNKTDLKEWFCIPEATWLLINWTLTNKNTSIRTSQIQMLFPVQSVQHKFYFFKEWTDYYILPSSFNIFNILKDRRSNFVR